MTSYEMAAAKQYIASLFADNDRMRDSLIEAEKIIDQIGIVAGRLDACGGERDDLIGLMQECSKELKNMAMLYWMHHYPIEIEYE